uniref:Amino acid transporter n=1 Tax=Neogobius melanostomus TaxID=47308 RepID=A0A8C6WXK1_9GOBI
MLSLLSHDLYFFLIGFLCVCVGVSLGFGLRTCGLTAQEVRAAFGMSSVEKKAYSKLGLRALLYYVTTTLIAALTGIALTSIIQPGKVHSHSEMSSSENIGVHTVDSFLDLLRNMFPSNLVEACFKKVNNAVSIFLFFSDSSDLFLLTIAVAGSSDGINILGLLVFCTALGLVLGGMENKGQPLRDFFTCLNTAIMNLVNIVMCSATLPVTFHCMEEMHKMDKKVTRFMLPLGATMNMDGAALYEAVAALFIAQIHNIDFSIGQIVILSFIVTAASTGAAGIPQAGMVSMLIVLTSVGLPAESISLLMLVDWILDRLRTATNVLGDCIGVGVVQHLSRNELERKSMGQTKGSWVKCLAPF